jgi:hypothetical protein
MLLIGISVLISHMGSEERRLKHTMNQTYSYVTHAQIHNQVIMGNILKNVLLSNFILSDSVYLPTRIFVDQYDVNVRQIQNNELCTDALRSLQTANAGGSSDISEAFSMDYFNNLYGINSFTLEMDVKYDVFNCSMCDFIMNVNNSNRIGVSVTRAYPYNQCIGNEMYSVNDANKLLKKKLFGLIVARSGVSKSQGFDKCILHIWAYNNIVVNSLTTAYDNIINEIDDADGIHDVVIIITVSDNNTIYTNKLS